MSKSGTVPAVEPAVRDDTGSRRPLLWVLAAVALWSGMAAAMGAALAEVSALRLLVWSYAVAAVVVAAHHLAWRRAPVRELFLAPPSVLVTGLPGILVWPVGLVFGLAFAPLVQANLISYLWPLSLVLLAPLAGDRFRRVYLLAALVGFGGAALMVTFPPRHRAAHPIHGVGILGGVRGGRGLGHLRNLPAPQ